MPEEAQEISNVITLHDHRCWQWDAQSLETIKEDLLSVDRVTESSFLDLGNKIEQFHGRAHGISRVAGEVLELLHGDNGADTLQHLQLLVERCNLWLSATNEKSTELCAMLNSVVVQISGLEVPIFGLRKVVKTLHSLRVSTRIEAAKGYASGAGVLAKSLDELSNMIYEKIAEICELTEALVPMINKSLGLEEAAQSGSIRIAGHEVQKARRLLDEFMANCLETGQWTDRLKERSEDVTQSFSEMIAALQFQDITRQRFEHVQKALTSLGQHMEQLSQHSDFGRDEEAARLFGRICRLQHDQLDLACNEFYLATDNLTENLHGMSMSIVSMAADTRELSRSTDLGCDNRFDAVLDVLKAIAGYLDETRNVHCEAGEQLVDVGRGVQKVADLVEEIELIGEEMQLLAMNAAISAAHAREQGAGLDVIAQNIHLVAEEATGYAMALAMECETITDHAADLQDVERETRSSTDDISCLLKEARQRMTTIENSCTALLGLATEVDRSAATLSDEVNDVVRTLVIRERFTEKLQPALNRLDGLGLSADEEVTASDSANLEALFSELEYCYTMASERQVHRQFVTEQETLSSTVSGEDELSSNRHHGLGDNVDLF